MSRDIPYFLLSLNGKEQQGVEPLHKSKYHDVNCWSRCVPKHTWPVHRCPGLILGIWRYQISVVSFGE